MKKFFALALFAALIVSPVCAQQVPDHAVPIGRGGGISGFKATQPGAIGQGVFSNGPTADPSFQFPPVFTPTVPGAVPAAGGSDPTKFLNQAGAFAPFPVSSFVPPGTGGITQSFQTRGQNIVYLTDYALCNGTDETTAIQNAINQTQAVKGTLVLPPNAPTLSCAFSGTLVISAPMTLAGHGMYQSMLLGMGGATQAMISVTSNVAVHFKDFWLNTTTSNKTGGYGIQFTGTAPNAESDFVTIERINFSNHQNAIDFENAAYWTVRGCVFQLLSNVGGAQVLIRNAASGDAGDNQFLENWFFGGFTSTTYVNWQTSGGTRFRGNKFLGNGTAGVALSFQLSGSTGTGLISIVDNSFDNLATVPVSFSLGASNVLTNITVNDNRFNGDNTHPTLAGVYGQAAAGGVLGAITVVGNVFVSMPTAVYFPSLSSANVSSNVFGGVTTCLNTGTVGAVLFASNLTGGCTNAPTSTSATVTLTANK